MHIRVTEKPTNLGPDPKVVLTFEGTHDVGRIVYLLAAGLTEHVHLAAQLVSKLRALPGGVAALQLLAKHGGTDYTAEWPGGFDPAAKEGE